MAQSSHAIDAVTALATTVCVAYWPAEQDVHEVAAPVWVSVSEPSAHAMHAPMPGLPWYRPISQLMQEVVPPVLYVPARQSAQGVLDTVETCPGTQASHELPPVLPFVGASEYAHEARPPEAGSTHEAWRSASVAPETIIDAQASCSVKVGLAADGAQVLVATSLPAAQAIHAVVETALYSPDVQPEHETAPRFIRVLVLLPGEHTRQEPCPAVSWYCPDKQSRQADPGMMKAQFALPPQSAWVVSAAHTERYVSSVAK